jgi:hypothetical protein
MAPVDDPWQARLNRMRQLLPLPMLALSAAITFSVPARPTGGRGWSWACR